MNVSRFALRLAGKLVGWKSPSLLGVASMGKRLTGSVNRVASCWLGREIEESLADASGFLWVFHAGNTSHGLRPEKRYIESFA